MKDSLQVKQSFLLEEIHVLQVSKHGSHILVGLANLMYEFFGHNYGSIQEPLY